MNMEYDTYEDGLRTVQHGDNYEYRIQLDRNKALWFIGTSNGPVPEKLRERYTSAANAHTAIKNYIASRPTPPGKFKDKEKA